MGSELKTEIPQNWVGRFIAIWSGQAFSILGSRLVSFALVWWMTKETGSAVVLATSTTMMYLPQIFLGPFVGALVDRWNRRLVIILSDSAVALATLVLVFLFWTDTVQLWHIYVLVFLRSLGGTFHFPAMQSSMSLLIPEKHLARVAGINQILDGGVNVLGPALGAFLMETMPIQGVLAVDVVTALIAIGPLLFIPIPQPVNGKPVARITPRVVIQDVAEGFRYVVGWRGVLIILSFAMVLNFLFAPTGSFLPLMVTEYFKGGVWHLGVLESLSGAGMIIGGVILSVWGGFRRRIFNILAGMGVMGCTAVIIGISPENGFFLAAGAFFVEGVANTIMNGGAISLIQAVVKPEMQGRVFSLVQCMSGVASPLGLLVAAPVVEKLGLQPWFIFCGSVSIILAAISPMIPDLINIESNSPSSKQPRLESQECSVAGEED